MFQIVLCAALDAMGGLLFFLVPGVVPLAWTLLLALFIYQVADASLNERRIKYDQNGPAQ